MAKDTHPGFGAFPKEHREFFDALSKDGWVDVVSHLGGPTGIRQKTLSGGFDLDAKTGALTRLTEWAAGTVAPDPAAHDWCEEVYLLSGTLSIGTPDAEQEVLTAGTYAVRPPHIQHGPFFSRDGCLMIEFLYYPPKGGD